MVPLYAVVFVGRRGTRRNQPRTTDCPLADKSDEIGVRGEVLARLQTKRFGQSRPCAIDPALDSADSRTGDLSGFLVGKAFRADQQQDLFLVVAQNAESFLEVDDIHMDLLIRQHGHAFGDRAVCVFDFAATLAQFREISVAKDRE